MRHPVRSFIARRPAALFVLAASLGGLSACDVFHSSTAAGGRNTPSVPEVVTPPEDPTPAPGTFYFALDGVPLSKTCLLYTSPSPRD